MRGEHGVDDAGDDALLGDGQRLDALKVLTDFLGEQGSESSFSG
jgi:hypothetical protein